MLRKIIAAALAAGLAKKAYDLYRDNRNGGKPLADVGDDARRPVRRVKTPPPDKTASPE